MANEKRREGASTASRVATRPAAFPLLGPRRRERVLGFSTYNIHQAVVSIPETKAGGVRLELQLYRDDFEFPRIEPIALIWTKSLSMPPAKEIAHATWEALAHTAPKFPRRRGGLAKWSIQIKRWEADILVRTDHRNLLSFFPQKLTEVQIHEAIDFWQYLLLKDVPGCMRHWPRDPDKWTWIYRAHLWTAMFVADEIAGLLMRNDRDLAAVFRQWEEQERKYRTGERFRDIAPMFGGNIEEEINLLAARATLEQRVRKAFPTGQLTQRRLAMALVDAKFAELYGPGRLLRQREGDAELESLLDSRRAGLDDGTTWASFLPRERKDRLQRLLRPARTVFEMWRWPRSKMEENLPAASVFSRWFNEFLHQPLQAMFPPPGNDAEPRRVPQILEIWGSSVWAARLY